MALEGARVQTSTWLRIHSMHSHGSKGQALLFRQSHAHVRMQLPAGLPSGMSGT